MQTMNAFLLRKSQRWIAYAAWLAAAGLAVADIISGTSISVLFLYIIPVLLLTWYGNQSLGVLLAVAASSVWFYESLVVQPIEGFVAPLFNNVVRLGVFLLIIRIVGQLRHMLNHERQLARTDPLTGALNWRAFDETAHKEVERSRRTQRPFTVAYLDLNDFKDVNDRFGHSTGDRVLKYTVLTARRTLRVNDAVARLGGDEFAVLLPETNRDAAQAVLHRVQQHLAAEMQLHGWPVTCSIGAVSYRVPPDSVPHMLHTADRVMYTAKQLSKNYLVVLEAEDVPVEDDTRHQHAVSAARAADGSAPASQSSTSAQTTQ